jgi:hypothetical protein
MDSLDVVDAAARDLWAVRPEIPQAPTGVFLSVLGPAGCTYECYQRRPRGVPTTMQQPGPGIIWKLSSSW